VNPRELLQSAQAAEREGDLARAGALLEQAARMYESTGHSARAEQMRRHVDRLGMAARAGARGVEEPPGRRGGARPDEPESLPGLDRTLVERTPTLADPELDAWCSFCCRPSREVGALVAGPAHAFVCRACVELAASLLGGGLQAGGAVARAHATSGAPAEPPAKLGLELSEALPESTVRRARAATHEALPTQVDAVARIEAALAAGHARVLLVGPAGSGKSTFLQLWASRGLGTPWDGSEPMAEQGAILVDDVDRLEPAALRQLARVLRSRPVVLALDATLPEPGEEVGGRRVHAPEQVESLAGSWLPGPALDGLTLECFRAPGDDELRLLAERWRAPDGSPVPPGALEEALRLAGRSARAAHALHALLLRWWASR